MAGIYGPTLPKDDVSESQNSSTIGPALPPDLIQHQTKSDENFADSTVDDRRFQDETQNFLGPTLPPHLIKRKSDNEISADSTVPELSIHKPLDDSYGPALPPHLQNVTSHDAKSDDEYGPLPADVSSTSHTQQALEERALQLKLDFLQGVKHDKPDVREEWMLELPDVGGAHLGLGPRQFRKNARPDFSDRSSWTDTPQDKEKRKAGKQQVGDLKKEAELQKIAKRNVEKDKLVADYNKKQKRDKSLVELHHEKLKKKKMDEGDATTTRRPFSRDIDLKVNQLDAAQKKSLMKNAMHLDDKFSRGQSKYL